MGFFDFLKRKKKTPTEEFDELYFDMLMSLGRFASKRKMSIKAITMYATENRKAQKTVSKAIAEAKIMELINQYAIIIGQYGDLLTKLDNIQDPREKGTRISEIGKKVAPRIKEASGDMEELIPILKEYSLDPTRLIRLFKEQEELLKRGK